MLRSIVLYLLRWLEESLDPDLKARVELLSKQATALDREHDRLLKDIAASERVNAELKTQFEANAAEYERIDREIKQSKKDLADRIAERARLSDAAKVELEL